MTNHTGRLYAAAVGLLAFFVLWAAIAAHPWQTTTAAKADPRLVALAQREHLLRREAVLVGQIVRQRAVAAKAAAARQAAAQQAAARQAAVQQVAAQQIRQATATAPPAPVRVVTLPPLVITRSS